MTAVHAAPVHVSVICGGVLVFSDDRTRDDCERIAEFVQPIPVLSGYRRSDDLEGQPARDQNDPDPDFRSTNHPFRELPPELHYQIAIRLPISNVVDLLTLSQESQQVFNNLPHDYFIHEIHELFRALVDKLSNDQRGADSPLHSLADEWFVSNAMTTISRKLTSYGDRLGPELLGALKSQYNAIYDDVSRYTFRIQIFSSGNPLPPKFDVGDGRVSAIPNNRSLGPG